MDGKLAKKLFRICIWIVDGIALLLLFVVSLTQQYRYLNKLIIGAFLANILLVLIFTLVNFRVNRTTQRATNVGHKGQEDQQSSE